MQIKLFELLKQTIDQFKRQFWGQLNQSINLLRNSLKIVVGWLQQFYNRKCNIVCQYLDKIKNIVVVWSIKMNNKNKNNSKRKDSHSRQHTSNLRSNSKSNQKSKHRSDSKLLLRLKQHDTSQPNASQEGNRQTVGNNTILHRINNKKVANNKHSDSSNEYYNHYRLKSKSKGKLTGPEEQTIKNMYLNSVYMHKEFNDPISNSHNQHLNKNINTSTKNNQKDQQPSHTNTHIMNKIKFIQKNGAIDANGKFVVKQVRQHDMYKNTDSIQTISIYEGEKKKDRVRKKEKTRKQMIKTKNRKDDKVYEGSKPAETSKLISVRSVDKFAKKKEPKDLYSPTILQNQTMKHYDLETTQNNQIRQNPYKVKEESKANPILSSRTSKTILSEQTQTSPQLIQDNSPPSLMQVNIDYIVRQLNQDKLFRLNSAKLKLIYRDNLLIQRIKCIQFLSKLCVSLNIRRQSHSLAIFYLDKYLLLLGQQVASKDLKLMSMTALLLAIKVDDGIMSRKLCHQYINRMQLILSMSNKTSSKSKSIMKYKEAISAFSSKENSGILNKSKSLSNTSELGLTKGNEMKKSRKQDVVHSKQMSYILTLQLDMLLKFGFKLVKRSSTYWVDILTLLWDDYINQQLTWELDLLFRHEKNKKNISHCYQIIQKLHLDLDVYNYSTPLLVLSAMYLILRMRLEEQKQGQYQQDIYTKYMSSLSKSTNLIFYDNVGINELFGDFLYQFQMNLSEIIQCIQFVGKNLMANMRTFTFNAKSQHVNCKSYEHHMSIYQGNCQIYKCIEDKY